MNRNERRRLKKLNKGKGSRSSLGAPPVLSAEMVDTLEAAVGHQQAGRLNEADALYRKVLAVDPGNAFANHLSGVIAYQKGDPQSAIDAIGKSLAREPGNGEAHKNLASALIGAGRLDDAERHLIRALELKPGYAEALNNLSFVQKEAGRFEEAAESSLAAIREKPDYAEAHNSLGNARMGAGLSQDAERSYRRALELNPGYAEAWNNLGLIVKNACRFDEAQSAFRNAIRLKPDFADAHNNLGMVLLLQGNLREGFTECEWRTGLASQQPFQRDLPAPAWTGEDLTGKRLLVYAEQGLGDTLQFVRYLPMLAERGCKLFFECQLPLVRLLADTDGVVQVFGHGEKLPEIDLHVSLMSLPHLLATKAETVPARIPYLKADPVQVEQWQQRLSPCQGFRAGLVWRGGAAHSNDKNRSISLDMVKKHFTAPDVTFISLQKELPEHERDLSGAFVGIGQELYDFADTAAAISNMDLVISVDTAVAHLAGAMGVQTWILLPKIPDWRWLLKRTDSPWYPGMRLFRQLHAGDWESVLEQIASQIGKQS